MHFFKQHILKKVLCISLLFLVKTNMFGYIDKAVLLHIRISNQHDTIGFNLAQDLPNFIYEQLKNNKLTLWDSPKKKTKINFLALQQIEKSSTANFINCSDIFIHEFWTCNKKTLSFVIAGFSFAFKSEQNFALFGFIDAQEAFAFLSKNNIPVNANAPADISYWEAINSKRFLFTIVQFGKKTLNKTDTQAAQLKQKIFNRKRTIIPSTPWEQSKNIGYELIDNLSIDKDWSIDLKKGLEEFINKDRFWVNEHGGKNLSDTNNYRTYLALTGLQIYETWQKRGNIVFYNIDSIILYVNNQKLSTFNNEDIEKFNLTVRFKTIADVLKEKEFQLNIITINQIPIPPNERAAYKKALENYKWTQITLYVKYTNN